SPVDFSNGIATYELDFGTAVLDLKLAVDSTFHYTMFLVQPNEGRREEDGEEEIIEEELSMKDTVISNVETKSELDLFVDSIARNYARNEKAQSLSVAVIHRNKINTFFYGETRKGNNTLPDANTIYETGSI